jgi:hypothetical protein
MPNVSGIDLATALCIDRPDMKVLLMSSLTWRMVRPRSLLDRRVDLQSPLLPDPHHLIGADRRSTDP